MSAYAQARALIDQAHAGDPTRAPDGRPAELVYGERVEAWVTRLVADASPALCLAARAQHLERWFVPRATFPEGKAGYLAWRRSLYIRQAERAQALLLAAGVPVPEAADVATWVSKTGLKTNAGTQALEDAACLVFLENHFAVFSERYDDDKVVDIVKKTWVKMSDNGHRAALGLAGQLPERARRLVEAALAA